MVLWEITAAAAYFLGLKRTYRIALRLQRRMVSPSHPRIRQFLHRRTRAIFEVAVKVHKNIQQRDLEVGRNLGNRVLRFLDRMKPSAQIRPPSGQLPNNSNMPITNHPCNSENSFGAHRPNSKISDHGAADNRKLFTSFHMPSVTFPTFTMMKPTKPAGLFRQQRHFSYNATGHFTLSLLYKRSQYVGVPRCDIAQWMSHM